MLSEVFGAEAPVFAAPMAGGPTTPALVAAAADAGSFGFLAGGYRTAEDLADQMTQTRRLTDRFGVNLFAPQAVPIETATYQRYRDGLVAKSERYQVDLPVEPRSDDDAWADKLEVLLAAPPRVVSFTFGIPDAAAIKALRRAGVVLAQTVTSPAEARAAADADMDLLVVQSPDAGGHSGTLTPDHALAAVSLPELIGRIRAATPLPILGGGGIGTADDVRAALSAGATAVAIGTALLLAPEAGTSAAHRRAISELADRPTAITRAFTGRPARGIHNSFMEAHPDAPLGYPAIHHLTQPIRRAAAVAGEVEDLHLWAGTSFRRTVARPAAETLNALTP